ncbi:hypothetical protein NYZ99_02360 [Maribacter litopenaei]|uniref:BlaR1 peptidase M56 n=1 Tax=Maribacter litopenaei TaxID=2976127 RepID=A0ABY5Y965_9FLAO|nr:hypothetical protein [Maribacter litopenaei]UWX55413.1 hypothetical protein NYZ99_02360 [Maribacter litopenaei]
MIQYILEIIAFQLTFLVIYDFFLKKETFFQWNRVYLLTTFIGSMALPWVKIEALRSESPIFKGYSEYLWSVQESPVTIVEASQDWFSIS